MPDSSRYPVSMTTLTQKQSAFVSHFIALNGNATQAAIAAGYSENTAAEIAYENLRKPQITQAIELRKQELARSGKSNEVTPEWVISKLAERAADDSSPASSVSALRTLADILGMTAGNRAELPTALTGMLEALKAGFVAGQQASMPASQQAHPVIELTGNTTDYADSES